MKGCGSGSADEIDIGAELESETTSVLEEAAESDGRMSVV